jgi:hypothetical protein
MFLDIVLSKLRDYCYNVKHWNNQHAEFPIFYSRFVDVAESFGIYQAINLLDPRENEWLGLDDNGELTQLIANVYSEMNSENPLVISAN